MPTRTSRRPVLRAVVPTFAAIAATAVSLSASAADPYPGWTMYASFFTSTDTVLLDLDGNVVKTWPSAFRPGASVYLGDDGAIYRTSNDPDIADFGGLGRGGRIERIGWDGTVEWSFALGGPNLVQHHDIEILPNGNILAIMWERFSAAEAAAVGRQPGAVGSDVWSEAIFEIRPIGATGGQIVWEWHVWDHLVQDFDASKPNFGDPSDHPGRIDINYGDVGNDWLHWNAIDYNAELDQIVISCRSFDEVWFISHAPGASGELLYRWGNPEAYGRGTAEDRRLFGQHDPEWIPAGLPGAGNLTFFNNGTDRKYSSIEEIDTGVNPDGTYTLRADGTYGPDGPVWICDAIDGETVYASVMSGVQRLPNGNTLVNLGDSGLFYELDESCTSVWSHDAGGPAFRATRIGARDPRLADLLWCTSDTNADDSIDFIDLEDVLARWGDCAGCEQDLDGDDRVGFADLSKLLSDWGTCVVASP